MEEIELMPGLKIVVDTEKFTVLSGIRLSLDEHWSNDIVLSFDATLRDILEPDNLSEIQGIFKLRKKNG